MVDNITLIGMPASGKSSIGSALARQTGYTFLDGDREIERRMGMKLPDILAKYGNSEFRRIEEDVNASLDVHHTIIAPGGSVIYGERAMRHFRELGEVVYLQLNYAAVAERLRNLQTRGVSMAPTQTLLDLYYERIPLYERWATIEISCSRRWPNGVVREILRLTGIPPLPKTAAVFSPEEGSAP